MLLNMHFLKSQSSEFQQSDRFHSWLCRKAQTYDQEAYETEGNKIIKYTILLNHFETFKLHSNSVII